MINIADTVEKLFPNLQFNLKVAHMKDTPKEFITKSLKFSIIFSALLTGFFALLGYGLIPIYVFIIIFILLFATFFFFLFKMPSFTIRRRKAEVESDFLYSSRYFLIRIGSGLPLSNALVEVSKTNSKSAKYFREIVADIELGTPLEQAIDHAVIYSPSRLFKKFLEQIKNSLETGSDIEQSIRSNIDEMMAGRLIEIQAYGKKLQPLSMFYMIIGTIFPSLGSAFFVMALSFVNIQMKLSILMSFVVLIAIVQYFFILLFKASRPAVAL